MTQYARLQLLLDPDLEQLDNTFERLREMVEGSGEQGRVQVHLLDDAEHHYFAFEMTKGSCHLSSERLEGPDLEIITAPDTWKQIAEGKLSPMDAFGRGKMRIRGDVELAKRLYRHLAAGEGPTELQ